MNTKKNRDEQSLNGDEHLSRDSFIFYRSFFEAISILSAKERVKVYDAICDYSLNFTTPQLTGTARALFTLIVPQLEANNKRFVSGSKAKRKQSGSKAEANKNDNVNVNVNGNGNVKNAPPLLFNHYMDVLDYLKYRGADNKSIEVNFENIIVKVSEHGKPYNAKTTKDLDRIQETRFLTYLMNNTEEIT